MKSRITIDFSGVEHPAGDPAQFEPVIRVSIVESDDVRDKLIETFFQSLGGESSWLKVEFNQYPGDENKNITIRPVRPSELKETVELIQDRLEPVKPDAFSITFDKNVIEKNRKEILGIS
jgi:hypothetical protein